MISFLLLIIRLVRVLISVNFIFTGNEIIKHFFWLRPFMIDIVGNVFIKH